jgi:superfamily I DNA and/or RNA helicase
VCTYTNVALDNLVDGFVKAQVKPLRIGHQHSVRSDLLDHSLDAQLAKHPLSRELLEILDEEKLMLVKMDALVKQEEALAKKMEKYADSDRQPRKDVLARLNNRRTAIMRLSIRQKAWSNKKYSVQQRMLKSTLNASDVVSIFSQGDALPGTVADNFLTS